jgi:hypothetical protein
MAAFNKFNQFVGDVGTGKHNLNADSFKIMLTNTAPVATNAVKADITDIAAGNGYTAGGTAVGTTAYSQTSGTGKMTGNDVTFTAAGGSFATFRYAVLYNDTQASPAKPLVGWWDYGAAVTLTDTNSFVVDLDQVNGILTIA